MPSAPAELACEVCGCEARAPVFIVDGYRIVRCRECGLVFVDGGPSADELVALYDESYYEDGDAPGYGGYGAAEQSKRHHDRTLLREIERYRPPGELLEIGCAYGYFLDEARTRGWTVRGSEPSSHASSLARERLGLDVTELPFSELPVEEAAVDAIVLWDVIEHLPNPRATLERAQRWLRDGGVLALSTGNVASLSARLHGAEWSLMTPPWHQFYFSRRSLRRLFERTGFEVLRFGGDGLVGVDPSSRRPRIRGPLASLLGSGPAVRVARRLGAGGIMFAYARKRRR